MNESTRDAEELLALSQRLLDAIDLKDWETYTKMCDPDLTAFETESNGHLIEGMPFHEFYFRLPKTGPARQSTISSPRVRFFGETAIVTYIRLVQATNRDQIPSESAFSESRIWVKQNERWIHVHFHRSHA